MLDDDRKTTTTLNPGGAGAGIWATKELEEATALDIRPIIAWEIERTRDTWQQYSGHEAGTKKNSLSYVPDLR